MKKILSFVLAFLCIFSLFGCEKEINHITDFSKYSDMTRETDKIEVTFDNHTGAPFYFTIENKEDIDEIMDIIFSSTFENSGKEVNDGTHTSIRIFQGEKVYSMHVARNMEGKNYYAFSTVDLMNKIEELAREAGAYEN